MTVKGDDKELMAAFAEFKEMLRRDVEPVVDDPSRPAAPPIMPERHAAPPAHAAPAPEVAAPKLRVGEPDRALAGSVAPKIPTPPRPDESWRPSRPSENVVFAAPDDDDAGRRRKLIYLSASIVVVGLAALGWTLAQGRGPQDQQAAVARIAEPEAAPVAESAATEQPRADAAALDTLADHASDPAKDSAPPPIEAATAPVDPSGKTPAAGPTATTGEAATVAPALKAAPAASTASLQSAAPLESKLSAPEPAAPPRPKAAAPAAAPEAPAAASPASAEPRAAQAKPGKPKAKPAAQSAAPAKPKSAKPGRSAPDQAPAPAAAAEPSPPPAPAPAPAPAQSDGGAFGFVKRTVNSVGSTIGNIGRSAAGIIP